MSKIKQKKKDSNFDDNELQKIQQVQNSINPLGAIASGCISLLQEHRALDDYINENLDKCSIVVRPISTKSIREVVQQFDPDSIILPPYKSKLFEIRDKYDAGEVAMYAYDLVKNKPGKLIEHLKSDPELFPRDDVITFAIGLLRDLARTGTQQQVSEAKRILKKAGLPLYSKGSPPRHHESAFILHWENEPSLLLVLVEDIRVKILKNLNIYKDEFIAYQKAYQECFGEEISVDDLNRILVREKDSDQWRTVLSLIAHRFNISYNVLRTTYLEATKQMNINQAREIQEQIQTWLKENKAQAIWSNIDGEFCSYLISKFLFPNKSTMKSESKKSATKSKKRTAKPKRKVAKL